MQPEIEVSQLLQKDFSRILDSRHKGYSTFKLAQANVREKSWILDWPPEILSTVFKIQNAVFRSLRDWYILDP